MALRVGYEKLNRETGWEPKVSLGGGRPAHDRLVRREPRALDRPRRLADARARAAQTDEPSVLVTGGGGFLGSHLVERLEARGDEVVVPRRARLRPDALGRRRAAVRGGAAGARLPPRGRGRRDRREPRQPGPLLVREPDRWARTCSSCRACTASRKLVVAGTVCAYPKFTPVAVPRGRALERLPGGDERAVRRREEVGPRRRRRPTASSTASTRLPAAGEPLRAARQLRPRDLARDPGADPQDGRRRPSEVVLWGDGSPTREFLYVEDGADGVRCSPPSATTAPEPVNLGTGVEISIRELAETIAELTGFEGEIVWDASMPNGQPRRRLDTSRAEAAVRLPRAHVAARRASSARSPGTGRSALAHADG